MKITKQQLATLNKAQATLRKIFESDELYDDALDAGCKPGSALLALGEVTRFLEEVK